MKLEEKRRHIEQEKRKMEFALSKQQQKVGKAAFLQAINKVRGVCYIILCAYYVKFKNSFFAFNNKNCLVFFFYHIHLPTIGFFILPF